MGRKGFLGEFEQVVLLALARLGADASGKEIYAEIERHTLAPVILTAVYVTLGRLEVKDYVASRLGEPTPVRGGRAPKLFTLRPQGTEALRRSREQLDRFWDGVVLDLPAKQAR